MTSLTRLMAAFSLALLPGFAFGHDYTLGDLRIEHPTARPAMATARASAGYLTIQNTGTRSDRLIAVKGPFPRIEMHDVVTDDAGVTMMQHQQDGIEIPAGASVSLSPGGYHVMFMGLGDAALEAGDQIEATLVFETAGEIQIMFNVEEPDTMQMDDDMDHGSMDHGSDTN